MFEGLLHRVQRAVNATLTKILGRAAVAVPLVVGVGFGVAAATVKLTEMYGPATSYLLMAVACAVVAGLIAMVVSISTDTESSPPDQSQQESPPLTAQASSLVDSVMDKDLLLAALSTAGPLAAPRLLRMAARNLPMVIMALLIGIFVLSRPEQETGGSVKPGTQPAE